MHRLRSTMPKTLTYANVNSGQKSGGYDPQQIKALCMSAILFKTQQNIMKWCSSISIKLL